MADDPNMNPLQFQQLQQQQLPRQHLQLHLFWQRQMQEIDEIEDFKSHHLPLARIKKIMKSDEDVRMISAEAPVLFAKACEMFILELTLRAWIHTEENKRRTLQRNDIAMAISKTDSFDFLIDIVPREDIKPLYTQDDMARAVMTPEQLQYYYQLAQQQQQQQVALSVNMGDQQLGRVDPVLLYQQQQQQQFMQQLQMHHSGSLQGQLSGQLSSGLSEVGDGLDPNNDRQQLGSGQTQF
eukprot:TRINITY_DN729_c0_g3_i1.p2 TRINITY_DN729_c0_g3~~TRINITY_DN729_c0_g3_i1.p2  ORF type:complete len:239 (-),score=67.67 TRINITY_DN729_c0_g3_i1:101-817(-)